MRRTNVSKFPILKCFKFMVSKFLFFIAKRLEEHAEKQMQHSNAASQDLEAMKRREEECKVDHDERHHVIIELDNRVYLYLLFLYLFVS